MSVKCLSKTGDPVFAVIEALSLKVVELATKISVLENQRGASGNDLEWARSFFKKFTHLVQF